MKVTKAHAILENVQTTSYNGAFHGRWCTSFKPSNQKKIHISLCFVIVFVSKCRTFSSDWVWNWYVITALFFTLKYRCFQIIMIPHKWFQPIEVAKGPLGSLKGNQVSNRSLVPTLSHAAVPVQMENWNCANIKKTTSGISHTQRNPTCRPRTGLIAQIYVLLISRPVKTYWLVYIHVQIRCT